MARLQSESIDMTLTSPPYDKLRKYNGYSFEFESIATELFRVTKQGGVVIWVVADSVINGSESGSSMRQALFFLSLGFRLHDTMIYAKNNFIPLTHNRYEQAWEYIFCFSKGKPKTFNPIRIPCKGGGTKYNLSRKGYCKTIKEGAQRRRDQNVTVNSHKLHSNIFYYSLGSLRTNHPAPFPRQLAVDQISTWSNPGDLIYDPMAGSGTSADVAQELRRTWLLSEISEEYCTSMKNRLPHLFAPQL